VSVVPFVRIPDDARLWVFAAADPLNTEQREALETRADDFVRGWLAHQQPVVGASETRYDRFLLVAADEAATGVSGCSIDSLFRVLKQAEQEFGTSMLDNSLIWFRTGEDEVRAVSRPEFRKLAGAGEVTGDTVVFDNTVSSVGALRSGRWETPARHAWHGQAFGLG
jgi:hypothetical protein